MESYGRGDLGEGPDSQERQGAIVGEGRGGRVGHHRKLLVPHRACLPADSQRVESSQCAPTPRARSHLPSIVLRTPPPALRESSCQPTALWAPPPTSQEAAHWPALDCAKLQFGFPKFTEKEKQKQDEEAQKPFPGKATGEFT